MVARDIFDINSKTSIVRRNLESCLIYDLNELDVEKYELPEEFRSNSFSFDKDNYKTAIENAVNIILPKENSKLDEQDYEELFTCTYEAMLNAYQHGNNYSEDKSVQVGHKITEDKAHIVVTDQGGKLNPSFVSFVLKHRQEKDLANNFTSFYDFSGNKQNNVNLGMGTYFMHVYADKINYYKGNDGGLVVSIEKVLKNKNSLL